MNPGLNPAYPEGRAGAGPARGHNGQVRVLLVEDNRKMATYLVRALREEGHEVETAHDGDRGLELARKETFDAIVLDVLLPARNGLEILAEIRRTRRTPVLVISALGETEDRIKGLDVGADDYLAKPFAVEEFTARVRALGRRAAPTATTLTCGDLTVDLLRHKASRAGRDIDLTAKEFALLEYLMRNQGRVLPRTSIAEEVWGYRFDWESNIIEVFINQLRRKIDRDSGRKLIHTVRGVGYRMRDDG